MKRKTFLILCGVSLLLSLQPAAAESRWVSDQFEIMLRTGPSTSNAIQLMVASGAELEVLAQDAESGFTQVRTPGGTEGWVLTRYLMAEPSAREQLIALSSQLTDATSRGSSLNSQLGAIRDDREAAGRQIRALESDKQDLEQQLSDIRRTAANAISINGQNEQLRQDLMDSGIRIDTLEQQNRELTSQTRRYWFMAGALVLVVGVVLGLWLPRIRWQRRSRYDRF